MIQLKTFFNRKRTIFALLFILLITAAVSFGYKKSQARRPPTAANETSDLSGSVGQAVATAGPARSNASVVSNDNLSKVTLSVGNMSCSGCISTIKSSVAGFQGIKDTLVELSSGKVEIYFDADQLKELSPVARAITDSGYPATILRTLSADEVKKERALAEARSALYVASVGGWDISRNEFKTELETAKKKYRKIYGEGLFSQEQGKTLLDDLKTQILSQLIDEGIMMQEIVKTGFKVDKETLDGHFQALLQQHGKTIEAFAASLNENGYDVEYFRKKFEIKILINQYLSQNILADASNEFEKQNRFNAWFKNSKTLAEVVYYDRDLEQLIQRRSAAGGCSVSG